MNSRRLVLVLAVPAAIALAGCASATAGKGSTTRSVTAPASSGAGSQGGQGSSGPAPAPGSGTPTTAKALGALMQHGLGSTNSAHIELSISVAGEAITGSGDEKLEAGKLTAMNLSETIPGAGTLQLILIDNKTYAKLPASLNKSSKPYVLVTPDSSDPTIQQLATTINSAQSSASIGSVGDFVAAADSVKLVGPETIGGTPTSHYSVVVNPSKLPADYPGKDALIQGGISTLPVELWIDSQGRPIQVTEKISVSGQSADTKIVVSKYNEPVTIAAPPASQVGTS